MQLAQVEPGLRTGFLLWAPYESVRRPGSTTQCGRFDWDNVLNCIVPAKAIGIKDSLMRLFCFVLFLWGTALAPAEDHRNKTDRKSTRLNSSHQIISYAVFCLKKKKHTVHTSE